jgi:hypothetical protein
LAGLELFANQAQTTVSSGGTTAPSAGTSESWTVTSSSGFPAASSAASPPTFFRVTDAAASSEKMIVTNVSGTTWTVTRGAEGTSPVTHSSSFIVQHVLTGAALEEFAQYGPSWQNVLAYGADPTGATACDTAVNAAVSALPGEGGVVYLPAGTYKVSSGITALLAGTQTVTVKGDGASATVLKYYGTGDCIRMHNSSAPGSGGAESYFSGIQDLTVDGTNGTGSPVGIHAGDITFLQLQGVIVQNFTGTSSIGLHLDNTVSYTEEGDYRLCVSNCTRGVVLETTTGYNSFGYSNFDLTFFQSGAQSCFCVINGALFYHGALRARGDVNGSASALTGNPAFFYVAGQGPGGSQASGGNPGIQGCHLDVLVEPNNLSGTATHFMSTLYLDNATSFGFLQECYGLLDFGLGTGSFTPIATAMLPGNNNNFTAFSGIINGDSNLNPSGVLGWNLWGSGSILNYLASYTDFDGYFPTAFGDIFFTTLDGSDATFALNYSGIGNGDTLAGPQRKVMFIRQPGSGGPYTLNFVVAGSATNAAPTINWPGGVAPVLSTVAGGTDVIEALTFDGATWYCRHLTSYGTATDQALTLRPEAQRVNLTTAFTSASGTSPQNITGLSAYLQVGTYKLTGWLPLKQASGTTATVHLGATFGGTATSAEGKWLMSSGTTQSPQVVTAVTTSSANSPTLTASLQMLAEFSCQAVVSAAGTFQLQVTASATGNTVTFPAGCYLDVEPLA